MFRMRLLRQVSLLFLLMWLATAISSAQEERTLIATHLGEPVGARDVTESGLSSRGPDYFTFRANVSEVQIRFQAVDPKGIPAAGLEPKDIQVITDGAFSAPIKSFDHVQDAPVLMGIVIDLSESVRPEMQLQEITFTNAVGEIFRPKWDRAFVVAFSNKSSVLQPTTTDFSQVQKAIERSPRVQNLTSLYDAIVATCRDQFAASRSGEKRVLFLFSDGVDNLSIHSLSDAIDYARKAGVVVNAITPADGPADGQRVLRMLTSQTGGYMEVLRNKETPKTSVASLRTLLGGEYMLSFQPPDHRPGAHTVQLKATTEAPIVLQAPAQYFVDGGSR